MIQAGAQTRELRPEAIALPAGYRIEPFIEGLNYPTSIAWDDDGRLLIAESTVPFGRTGQTEIRILRREPTGALQTVAGNLDGMVNDIAVHQGRLYLSRMGSISIVEGDGLRDVITGLPSWGLHENNALAFGADGRLYFGQGTISNAGVLDTYALERLRFHGHLEAYDTPGAPVILTGVNYPSTDMLHTHETRLTGAFLPWGTAGAPGQRVPGPQPGRPASGAIMTAWPDGSDLRVYAWGFRNPFGLAFGPDGRLYVTNDGANRIPPRQISGDPGTLWAVEEGMWYGWPDFFAGQPVTDPAFKPPDAPHHEFVIANHNELLQGRPRPPDPIVAFGLHFAPCKFDFSPGPEFGFAGEAFVAEFGSLIAPEEDLLPGRVNGRQIVRVDIGRRAVEVFAANRDDGGGRGGLERPIQARFGPDGALYIVDLGLLDWGNGWEAPPSTGVIWRVTAGSHRP